MAGLKRKVVAALKRQQGVYYINGEVKDGKNRCAL